MDFSLYMAFQIASILQDGIALSSPWWQVMYATMARKMATSSAVATCRPEVGMGSVTYFFATYKYTESIRSTTARGMGWLRVEPGRFGLSAFDTALTSGSDCSWENSMGRRWSRRMTSWGTRARFRNSFGRS